MHDFTRTFRKRALTLMVLKQLREEGDVQKLFQECIELRDALDNYRTLAKRMRQNKLYAICKIDQRAAILINEMIIFGLLKSRMLAEKELSMIEEISGVPIQMPDEYPAHKSRKLLLMDSIAIMALNYAVNGASDEEIAGILDITVPTVKAIIREFKGHGEREQGTR